MEVLVFEMSEMVKGFLFGILIVIAVLCLTPLPELLGAFLKGWLSK